MSEGGTPAAAGDGASTSAAQRPKGRKKAAASKPAEPDSAAASTSRESKQPGGYRYQFEDKQVVDYIREATKKNIWYYRDRMSVPRGPCSLPVLKECWVHGVIDENTLVWGQGLQDWLPVRNVRTLVPQIRTPEVALATWVKKTFALRPAWNRIRRHRAEQRLHKSDQVEDMF